MQELFPQVTIEIADKSDWINLCSSIPEKSSTALYSTFSTAAKNAKAAGDEPMSEFYGLLSQIFSMAYRQDNLEEPFGPLWVMNGGRTAIATDFTDANLDIFAHLIGKSGETTVDARISDILWLRRKKVKDAETAISNYIAHAKENLKIQNEEWNHALESLERACQLWKQLGSQAQFASEIEAMILNCLDENEPEPNNYFRIKILRIVTKYSLSTNSTTRQQWTEKLAEEVLKAKDFHKANDYLEISLDLARLSKDSASETRIKRKIVDYLVEEARTLKADGAQGILLAGWYSQAIEAARRHGGLRELVDDLHKEMNEAQKVALSELKPVEVSVDVTKYVNAGRDAVAEVPIEQALIEIAKLAQPVSIGGLKKIVEDLANKYPLTYHISGVAYNDKGRVVARTSAALASGDKEQEAGIQAHMITECGRQQELLGRTLFHSARLALKERMPICSGIFEDLVNNNPFVPQGREGLYLKGLKAGLNGDFVSCAHHLIPQLENSIRTMMEASGKLVTRLTDDMTQKEHDLNKLLYEESVKEYFGEDLVYSLRVLLVEELGGNYRNRLAHGLLDEGHFYGGWVNYLWAITIRMLWIGRLIVEDWEDQRQVKDPISTAS